MLAGRPALALLDEPTRGMDDKARSSLVSLVASLKGDGAAVVVATHDGRLATELGDRMLLVDAGRVKELPA